MYKNIIETVGELDWRFTILSELDRCGHYSLKLNTLEEDEEEEEADNFFSISNSRGGSI